MTSSTWYARLGDPNATDDLYEECEFIGDVSGRVLDHGLAVKARSLEMGLFWKMTVYDKKFGAATARHVCRVISAKWVDINKGDQWTPNNRARVVGRKQKRDSHFDFVAVAPLLEALRLICSTCQTCCFYARSRRPVYTVGFEPGDAQKVASLWACAEHFFTVSSASELAKRRHTNSTDKQKERFFPAHGDDFTIIGPQESLSWLRRAHHQCVRLENEVRVLHRTLRWTHSSFTSEAEQHAEAIIKDCNVRISNNSRSNNSVCEDPIAFLSLLEATPQSPDQRVQAGSVLVSTPAVPGARLMMEQRENRK